MSIKWLTVLLVLECLAALVACHEANRESCSPDKFNAKNLGIDNLKRYSECKGFLLDQLTKIVSLIPEKDKTISEVYMEHIGDGSDEKLILATLQDIYASVKGNLRPDYIIDYTFEDTFHSMINSMVNPFRKLYGQVRIYEAICGKLVDSESIEKLRTLVDGDKQTINYIMRAKNMMRLDADRDDWAERLKSRI